MIFLFGYNSISAILRGLGDSKNASLFPDCLFNFKCYSGGAFCPWFSLGIAGSALATVIAQGTSFLMGVAYLNKTHKVLKFRLKGLEFDRAIFRKSLAIGLPTGLQQMFVAAGMMPYPAGERLWHKRHGGFYRRGRLDTFAVMPAMNLSAAVTTFTAQNLGAGKMERVKHGLKAGW